MARTGWRAFDRSRGWRRRISREESERTGSRCRSLVLFARIRKRDRKWRRSRDGTTPERATMNRARDSLERFPADRAVLPVRRRPAQAPTSLDARDTTAAPALEEVRAPDGAPNVVVILLDDVGFGAPSVFGGPCEMPNAERLADGGLRYTRFHVTALCSPTRQALLTGRNHHSVGMGAITNFATSAPGYNGIRPPEAATLARVMNGNGYSTSAFGKWHQTPQWELSASGPFDRWPTGEGFEKFYGFMSGACSHWEPFLFDGTTPVEPLAETTDDESRAYHLSEDLADHAVDWVRLQHTLTPDKPFFMYLAFGACHSPHHVPGKWRDKYRGRFDRGWDHQRVATLARQQELGIVPREADLAPWPEGVPHWEELDGTEQRVAAAFMENFAGFAEHTDAQVGRVVTAIEGLGILENTLIIYILGDNGGSAEGGMYGTLNQLAVYNGFTDTAASMVDRLDELGGPTSNPNYPIGWALATNSPYQWTKQVASHLGGTRTGLIVHWPMGIDEQGGLRHQWHHVIDIVPTIFDAAGIPAPQQVDGVDQMPIHGTSILYTMNDASAPDRRVTQYFEMIGNRGIYHRGWMAVTRHRAPWALGSSAPQPLADDVWELYDLTRDWTQAHDLAKESPGMLRELQDLFLAEAAKFQVFPLDDRFAERANPSVAGRPDLLGDRTRMRFTSGMGRFSEDTVPNTKNRSHTITAEIALPTGSATGVIISQGSRSGGWTLYVRDMQLIYAYNFFDIERYEIRGAEPLKSGLHRVEYRFDYDGGGIGKGGTGALFVGGRLAARSRIERTIPLFCCSDADQTLDVGMDLGTVVPDAYGVSGSYFTGQIHWVEIDVMPDAAMPSNSQLAMSALAQH